ncbi:transposase, MuDR, MULE transposase domain protein [Tanacetum coccineum]
MKSKLWFKKLIDEDNGRQNAILDLALQFKNSYTAKDDLIKAYEKCNDISQESRALIDSFLKEGCDKDYELNLSMYEKAAKLENFKDAKLAWLLDKYYYRSQESVGCSSSHADLYLTEKELLPLLGKVKVDTYYGTEVVYQLHLDEEALRETLEEQAMDAKAREEKIRQKQADDDEFFFTFGRVSSSTCFEPSSSTPNPVRIISGLAGLVQRAKQLKENVFILDPDGALMSTQEYMQKVVEDVGEDSDFNSGAWISTTNYVLSTGGTVTGCLGDIDNFLEKRKLAQVVAIVKTCSPNALGDLNVTMKDLSGTVRGTVHYKVLDVGTYGKDIHVGAAMILAKVSVFTPRPSEHYLNITKKNVVKVFRKDTVSLA